MNYNSLSPESLLQIVAWFKQMSLDVEVGCPQFAILHKSLDSSSNDVFILRCYHSNNTYSDYSDMLTWSQVRDVLWVVAVRLTIEPFDA